MAIIDKPTDYFETVLYTGNGGTQSITSLDFAPALCWFKSRTTTDAHAWYDSVRGATKRIKSNSTDAETTQSTALTSFNSDGFSIGAGGDVNTSSASMVAWNWKAGTSFTNDASATGIGTIDSTGSVNTDAGFSIVSYTGTGSTGTVAHGLGAVPKMMIIKGRSFSDAWIVYHKNIGATKDLRLNLTNAASTNSGPFNNTEPTSSLFTVGSGTATNNGSATFIAYCFAEKQGYSKISSYSSNSNADGPFVYLGFKPAFLIVKCTTAAEGWAIMDSTREPTNDVSFATLSANTSGSEGSLVIDFLSNGFKPRQVSGQINKSGSHSYIYMAFAENPFVTSTGVPATAR